MTALKSIQSELIKLKYPPILWLIGFIILVILAIVFSAHYIDIHKTVTLGRNPWTKINMVGQSIFSIFISIPFIVLFMSAAIHIEHQNHGFKQLYTLPRGRSILLIHKLSALFICLLLAITILIIGVVIVGYLLNMIYPETEFNYYNLSLYSSVKSYCYIVVSLLGVIGIQFFLSLRFKGFLLPASIGIMFYILGLILSSVNNSLSLYFPYSFPIIARDRGVINNSALNIDQFVVLNNVELLSIGIFIAFVSLSLCSERKRNI